MMPIQVIKSAFTILSVLADKGLQYGKVTCALTFCRNMFISECAVSIVHKTAVNPGTRRTGELLRSHFYGCTDGSFVGFTARQCTSTSGEDREERCFRIPVASK